MNFNTKYIAGIWVAAMLSLSSCDKDFEEVNINPNSPETVSSSLLLPTIIRNTTNEIAGKAWGYGNVVMQQTAKIQFTNEDRYNWGPEGDPYGTFYNSMRDLSNVIEISSEAGQSNYVGIALVLRASLYSFMTDAYGDLPYVEATQAKSEVNYPVFDTQEDIYKGILSELEQANTLLGSTSESVEGDILFDGDVMRWKKYANSLRLRILMRLSDRMNPAADMQAIVSNPTQFPIFTSNDDHALLQYLQDVPNQHILYTTRSGSFDEYRLSEKMESVLKDLNDPRLYAYAQPTNDSGAGVIGAKDAYQGVPNGLADEEALAYSPSGDPAKGGSNFISRVGYLWSCSACTSLANPIGAQAILMSYSELQFVLAEARERGYITTGTAEDYYTNGVKSSFAYYKSRYEVIDLPQIADKLVVGDAYFAQSGVTYTGSSEEKLAKIGTQKWLALFFSGMEGWYDWRRTDYPKITPGPAAYISTVPVRFMYPGSVQALNKQNYEIALARQGADAITTHVWWDVD
ncbi:SusD/RagB family nutrient-binding outer membrane lipoprotein [Algoriphagus antarcticus]|uniref:SusD-like starch-binding protein associating with outer membrane n=1 Tax=Algoriphagus antarcticus TaxID=238540 RepID=A0A3E0E0K9_9BACT|nr:SusD/RagB family nutrient-binding outer membrane lipoprotein [Algoriphagus antarcticus]REG90416.1 SusD-like starch-binding protein associating with outer membrane [Algoriphagus antarcticus]